VEKAFALREATFNSPLLWKKLYAKVETVGSETIAGMACHTVKLSPAAGHPIYDYFAKASGLRVKSETVIGTPSGEVASESLYNDYRFVSGIRFPFRMMHRAGDEASLIALNKIECNLEMVWSRFDPPREIKALLIKGKN
jgi:zinc protease